METKFEPVMSGRRAPVAPLPATPSGTGGATLSLDGNAPPRVILARRLSPVALTPAQFSDAFTGFVDQLHHWADELNAAAPAKRPEMGHFA